MIDKTCMYTWYTHKKKTRKQYTYQYTLISNLYSFFNKQKTKSVLTGDCLESLSLISPTSTILKYTKH